MPPTLPARKAGGRRTAPVSSRNNQSVYAVREIELEDGSKVPVKIPNGMPPQQAEALLAYLKANPEQAKQAHEQAQQLLRTPGMANAFMNMQPNASTQNPQLAERLSVLKDDPELKGVFEDVAANGPAAFQKYWDDTELMTKVSAKLGGLNLSQGSSGASAAPPPSPTTLHGAARLGDADAIKKLVDEGKDVNELNERGITALGVAVGFNRMSAVEALLEKGAAIEKQDLQGNTVLHYAAGYGRREIAQKLMDSGADLEAKNGKGQKPIDVAKLNQEMKMVDLLQSKAAPANGTK